MIKSNKNNKNNYQVYQIRKDNDSIEQRTYDYWKGLSCNEQQEYFANSRTCQKYGENYRYDNHELMAKTAARIGLIGGEPTLHPRFREFLEYCYANGVKMCIASATAPDLIAVAMQHCDIEKYFLKVFSCGEIGKGKEKPDVFILANHLLGEKQEDTWVFEDSLTAIETASGIGMQTVGIYDRFNFGQNRIKEIASIYIDEGETLLKLIKE